MPRGRAKRRKAGSCPMRSPPITPSQAGTMQAESSHTARPTSAAISAPASFRPSPTISTRRPAASPRRRFAVCRRATAGSACAGRTGATSGASVADVARHQHQPMPCAASATAASMPGAGGGRAAPSRRPSPRPRVGRRGAGGLLRQRRHKARRADRDTMPVDHTGQPLSGHVAHVDGARQTTPAGTQRRWPRRWRR